MLTDEFDKDAGRLLAAMDFAAMAASQEEKRRQEMSAVLRDFLEVIDSLQALETHCRELAESGQAQMPLRSVSVTLRQAQRAVSKSGVEPINCVGFKLDLDLHEVVTVSETSAADADMVVEEASTGYLWNGRLLRRAKVIVSSGTGPSSVESQQASRGETR
jgi:molecular chaperone GrpE